MLFKNWIIFVFIFGRNFQTKYIRICIRLLFFNRIYSYSYSVYDNIRIIFAFQLTWKYNLTASKPIYKEASKPVSGRGEWELRISVVFQWTHSPIPPPLSCCRHSLQCRRRMYSKIFEYLCFRIYSYSYLVDIFKPNTFVFVYGFYFWNEYIRIRIRWLKYYSLTSGTDRPTLLLERLVALKNSGNCDKK